MTESNIVEKYIFYAIFPYHLALDCDLHSLAVYHKFYSISYLILLYVFLVREVSCLQQKQHEYIDLSIECIITETSIYIFYICDFACFCVMMYPPLSPYSMKQQQ